jgi:hypothetical protein
MLARRLRTFSRSEANQQFSHGSHGLLADTFHPEHAIEESHDRRVNFHKVCVSHEVMRVVRYN